MPQIPDLISMLQAGVHFGHKLSRRNPKMEPYIFAAKSGFHIINLEETQRQLQRALDAVTSIVANGGVVLFLGTKKQACGIITKHAQACGMPYINERWLGGTVTNFVAIHKLITKYVSLKEQKEKGQLDQYTKKERLEFDREIARLDKTVGGVATLNKIPDAIFVVDIKKEKTAVAEARSKRIPIIAMCDTNANPDVVTYPIPANDDAVKSIELITALIAQAVMDGKKSKPAPKPAEKPAKA